MFFGVQKYKKFCFSFYLCTQKFNEMRKLSRIEEERRIVEQMIRIYCRHKEGNRTLCNNCQSLLAYATARLNNCPFKDHKKTCRLCPKHCYKPDMRAQIRNVMRYAGPRMLFYHPIAALQHIWREYGEHLIRKKTLSTKTSVE